MAYRTIYRGRADGVRAEGTGNATGHFVQNAHGATVAGPYVTAKEAWREEDRLARDTSAAALRHASKLFTLAFSEDAK